MRLVTVIVALFTLVACNIDNDIEGNSAPRIEFPDGQRIFSCKQDEPVFISPVVTGSPELDVWWLDEAENVVSHTMSLEFSASQTGEYFRTICASNPYGETRMEIKIVVMGKESPELSLPGHEHGFTLLVGKPFLFSPSVSQSTLETRFEWRVDSNIVCREKDFTFTAEHKGEYSLSVRAFNADGEDELQFTVLAVGEDDIPFSWTFETEHYNVSLGREILITPLDISNALDALYTWSVDGIEREPSQSPELIFVAAQEGMHSLSVTMRNSFVERTHSLTVFVAPKAGTYRRDRTDSSMASCTHVYEYTPAPGQFINENFTCNTAAEASAYALDRLQKGMYVSLGGFGGYITVGFDHSISCSGGYDFSIDGNSFDSSSEPGIVWVMQDENGDGLPNDTWYELLGSDTANPETIHGYAVTYTRPGTASPVQWTDNEGNRGEIDYLGQFHKQSTYYPLWVKEDKYTLRGTRLKERNYDASGQGNNWIQPPYDWGYADNYSSVDRFMDFMTMKPEGKRNHFKISNAIDFKGSHIDLEYIDFIKVQTGCNTKSGWLGENSTEVLGFNDDSML